MDNLLIKKYNEYLAKINIHLNDLSINPNHVFITEQLLDRLEKINRQMFSLNQFEDNPSQFCNRLASIRSISDENYSIMDEFVSNDYDRAPNIEELRQLLFLMNDLFYQSQVLIESIYQKS